MKFQLVSFKLCPYVQRSVITLNYKKVPFDITYIDLDNPPQWFNKISPLGQVPLLIVDDKTVLFESAVINEFIDEVSGERLLSQDPLKKAYERAWISFGGDLIGSLYGLTTATEKSEVETLKADVFNDLSRFEEILPSETPYFNGKKFGLVDTSVAPFFQRLFLSPVMNNDEAWKKLPKTRKWGEALQQMQAVKDSVVPEFNELYVNYCKEKLGSVIY